MPHRTFDEGRRHGRDDDHRRDRGRNRQDYRYGAEGPSWDDSPASGYREGGYRAGEDREGYGADFGSPEYRQRYGASESYGSGGDYGRYRQRNDGYGESGRRSGGYAEGGRGAGQSGYGGYDQGRYTRGGGGSYGGWNTGFGGDYGQGGQGGFGSGGYDGESQTGGSQGLQGNRSPAGYGQSSYGQSSYGQSEYTPGGQTSQGQGHDAASGRGQDHRHHDFEPDYLHWRESQMRDLDRDYHEWRSERRQKFSREFDDWRTQRRTQSSQQGEGSTLSQAGGGYGTAGASSDGDQGGTLQSNPQVAKVSGPDKNKN